MPTFRLKPDLGPVILAKVVARSSAAPSWNRCAITSRDVGSYGHNPEHDQIDYEKLGRILHFPTEGLPPEMVRSARSRRRDVDVTSGWTGCSRRRQRKDYLSLAQNSSPADVAIQVVAAGAQRCWRDLHAENYTIRQKNFCYFARHHGEPRDFPNVSDERRKTLERDLDEGFEQYKRGRWQPRINFRPRVAEVSIIVRRGATFRREESMKDAPAGSAALPTHDVRRAGLRHRNRRSRSARGAKWQERLYLRCIGQYVFGDPDYFPAEREISFDPLVRHGARALNCGDVPGMQAVKLVEVQKRWNNAQHEIDIKKANESSPPSATGGAVFSAAAS